MADEAVRDALLVLAQAQVRTEARIESLADKMESLADMTRGLAGAVERLVDATGTMGRGVGRLVEAVASLTEAQRATQALLSADIQALIRRIDTLIERRGNGAGTDA